MKKMKKIIAAILATACTFSVLSMTACEASKDANFWDTVKGWFDKADEEPSETPDAGKDDDAGEMPDDGTDEEPSETPDDGKDGAGETPDDGTDEPTSGGNISTTDEVQYLRAGGTYAMSKSVAFLSTDVATTSSYTPVTSTINATVEPADAYQRVDWTYAFVNESSAWAKGKKISDYLTITPQADGSTGLKVTCKQPFGEQIKITCTSRANSNIKASTVVDFLGVSELQTVMLGSGSNAITVNLGGETIVNFADGKGGSLAFGQYKASNASVYTKLATVDDFDVFNFDLLTPAVYYNKDVSGLDVWEDGYLTADVDDVLGGFGSIGKTYIDDIGVIQKQQQRTFYTNDLYGDLRIQYKTTAGKYFDESISEYSSDVRELLQTLSENSLYTFVLHVEVGGAVQTYYSLMKLQIV
ncbi:MAG: hypothetical protein E7357_01325 [Clostridiales bacterium]|nr:hypothetical protein [Clostridiales bacterium]